MSVEDLWSRNSDKLLTDLQELIELRCARSAFPSNLLEAEKEEQTPQFFDSEFHMENPGAPAGREAYLNGSLLSKRQRGTEFSMNLVEIDEDAADVDADTDEIEIRERKVFEEIPCQENISTKGHEEENPRFVCHDLGFFYVFLLVRLV